MHSIRFRLIALFVVVVTVTLGGFGVYGQLRLSRELEARFAERQQETLVRLKTSLPVALWSFDKAMAERIIQAEMQPQEVMSLTVYDADSRQFVFVDRKGSKEAGKPADAVPGISVEAMLYANNDNAAASAGGKAPPALGRVVASFSRDHIDAALRGSLLTRLVEILILDSLLVLALTFSLQMVFRPIEQLRNALFELAGHENEDAEELPETTRNEFGEVIKGFNMTQRKLRQVIQRSRQAEEAARVAAVKTEQAYQELQAAQESLVQSEKMASLGGLVAGVAHEINTPVGVVMTSASVLSESTEGLAKAMAGGAVKKSDITAYLGTAEESSRLILANAQRAAHLIQSFKQVAVDQTSDERRKFELRYYLDELITSLGPTLKKGHASVTIDCPNEVILDSYPGLLAQVLTNLTMNALTHAFPEGTEGHIDINVKSDGPSVTVIFRDDGRGIPPDHLAKVFDPFFTTKRGSGGTGLGLNIVFNIMTKKFSGNITVQNNPDRGACFMLSFPRVTPNAANV